MTCRDTQTQYSSCAYRNSASSQQPNMAYAALVSLSQTSDRILNHNAYSISLNEKEKILSMGECVKYLLPSLQNSQETDNVRLEGRITEAANEAEDILEYFMWNQIQSRFTWMGWCTSWISRYNFREQLKNALDEIALVTEEMKGAKKCLRIEGIDCYSSSSRRELTSNKEMVVGLDDDVLEIQSRICTESSKLDVIPILGMGGIGKTTVARITFDSPLIREQFDIRGWVTVSQSYSRKKLLSDLLVWLNQEMFNQGDEATMAEKAYKILNCRRYIIVMDDVWHKRVLDDVMSVFPNDGNGSRIVLTTRIKDVAAYTRSSSPPHELRFLDENQSWKLLKQKVFTKYEYCPPELEYVGKLIARRCGGLALAIVLVAGILCSAARTQALWNAIHGNIKAVVAHEQLERIVSQSYQHLPHRLRPCFLFLGGFPEDHEIRVSRLIKLWVAEGFLERRGGGGGGGECRSLEEVAEEYLEDLVRRNLVLARSRKPNGEIKSCCLHDLVRDLCIRKAQKEKFLRRFHGSLMKDERRIATSHSCLDELQNIWGGAITIHTIVCFDQNDGSSSLAFVGSFRLLRVLDVVNDAVLLLPPQLFDLFHLRYLALGNSVDIPPSISNLHNLQTLIICPRMKWAGYSHRPRHYSFLPPEIWNMPQLRNLIFFYSFELPQLPAAGGAMTTPPLEKLQTLSEVTSLVCRKRVLRLFPNLKKLGLVYHRSQNYRLRNLRRLSHLEKLKLTMDHSCSLQGQIDVFPDTLRKLTLVGGGLSWEDMTAAVASLPNLQVLKLKACACDGGSWETGEEQFRQLKFLLLHELNLEYWITDSSHFPKLERLVVHGCRFLGEIPPDVGDISTLQLIEVHRVNKSVVESAKQILEDQRDLGNDILQVRFF